MLPCATCRISISSHVYLQSLIERFTCQKEHCRWEEERTILFNHYMYMYFGWVQFRGGVHAVTMMTVKCGRGLDRTATNFDKTTQTHPNSLLE